MKKTVIALTAAAVCAAALTGCEWGGVHSGESWNDTYAWANFSGTYKLASAVSSSATATNTATFSVSRTFSGNGSYSSGKTALVPGSVSVTVGGNSNVSFTDNGNGTMSTSASGSYSATINYSSGSVTVNMGGNQNFSTVAISGSYYVSGAASSGTSTVSSPITWLNLTQKGTLLTFTDNNGTTYSGKVTGASCPRADEDGYVAAAHIRFTFEATSTSNSRVKLTGSLSGDWSGGSSTASGTLSNRVIDANYSNGSSTVQFMAVSGSVTLYATGVSSSGSAE